MHSINIHAFGETKTISDWAKDPRCSVERLTVWERIFKQKWPPEKAITTTKQIYRDHDGYRLDYYLTDPELNPQRLTKWTVNRRLKKGMTITEALAKPKKKNRAVQPQPVQVGEQFGDPAVTVRNKDKVREKGVPYSYVEDVRKYKSITDWMFADD